MFQKKLFSWLFSPSFDNLSYIQMLFDEYNLDILQQECFVN